MNTVLSLAWIAIVVLGVLMWVSGYSAVLRILKRKSIRYAKWDHGLNAIWRFKELTAEERRPRRRKAFQWVQGRMLVGFGLLIAAWVLALASAFGDW
jgi:hypothetical protein